MKSKSRLGKGIEAIFPDNLMDQNSQIIQLSVDEIIPNPIQPRQEIDEDKLHELAESIKINGVISPIVVRKIETKYEIIAGERRFHASILAGLEMIPCIVREMADEEAFKISLIENLQREDLNPMDEAEAYFFLSKQYNLTHQEISDSVSKDRSTITNSLRLVTLPEEVKESLRKGNITNGHARAILMINDHTGRIFLLNKIISHKLSVRETEKYASKNKRVRANKLIKSDRYLDKLSFALSEKLSTKVACTWGKRKGKIIIELVSKEDLERIVDEILQSEYPL